MATNGRADWRRLRLLELFVGVYRERMEIVERMHRLVAMTAIRNVKSILAGIHRRTERLLNSTGAWLITRCAGLKRICGIGETKSVSIRNTRKRSMVAQARPLNLSRYIASPITDRLKDWVLSAGSSKRCCHAKAPCTWVIASPWK